MATTIQRTIAPRDDVKTRIAQFLKKRMNEMSQERWKHDPTAKAVTPTEIALAAGIPDNTLSRLKDGKNAPSIDTVLKLAPVVGEDIWVAYIGMDWKLAEIWKRIEDGDPAAERARDQAWDYYERERSHTGGDNTHGFARERVGT
jgi:transcriptional regulator with XRE-family HTH domain